MKINFKLLALYAFCLVIMYLAGIYFGDVLQVLFVFFCLYPVFSFVSLIIWYAGMDFEETFSTTMPVKGEKLDYRLMIFNRSLSTCSAGKSMIHVSENERSSLAALTIIWSSYFPASQ